MLDHSEGPAKTDRVTTTERDGLAALRTYALGPMNAVFTWEDAAAVLELVDLLTKGGIIEVAIRNPSVAEYMDHWESRALKAEAHKE